MGNGYVLAGYVVTYGSILLYGASLVWRLNKRAKKV